MFVRFEIACVDNFNDMDNNWSNAIVVQVQKEKRTEQIYLEVF